MATQSGSPLRRERASSRGSSSSHPRRFSSPVRSSVRATFSSRASRSRALERHCGLRGEHPHRRRDPARSRRRHASSRRPARRPPPRCAGRARSASTRRPSPSTTRCEIRSSPRASSTKSGFFERKTASAPEASSPSGTVSGGLLSRPWFAVITISPSGLRSMSLAKRAPVTVQAAVQMISRRHLGVRSCGPAHGSPR